LGGVRAERNEKWSRDIVVPHPTVLLTSFFLWRYRGIHSFCFGGVEVLCIHVVLNRSILMYLLKVLSDTGF